MFAFNPPADIPEKVVRVKMNSGDLHIFKSVLEFNVGKMFLTIVLNTDPLTSVAIPKTEIFKAEMKRHDGEFTIINLNVKRLTKKNLRMAS